MADKKFKSNPPRSPAGLVRLIQDLKLSIPLPVVRSEIVSGSRRTTITDSLVVEQYPRSYSPPNRASTNLLGHLKFAMRYEPVDAGILKAVFAALDVKRLEAWVKREHTGIFARRAWYLYELLIGRPLKVPDVPATGYVDLLDPKIHVTGPGTRIRRQRINDNLLGNGDYCPLIRRTETLQTGMDSGLDRETRALLESCDPGILARALNYLYTTETKSSFAIEGEVPKPERAERFVAALSQAGTFDPADPQALVRLQNSIVDARYASRGWRTVQNFVSQTRSDYTEHVHFVCPKPEDVPDLMRAWMQSLDRLHHPSVDAVCAAAAAAFGFVFLHPFDDGNGRIHRFLIHHMLARAGFTPDGLLLPVSAVMLRDRKAYDRALNRYSQSIMPFIRYDMDDEGRMIVNNETAPLYRYWDATIFAEYLYSCITQAVRHDLKEEIGFLRTFDAAVRRTMEIVDMPDRRASLLVRLILQNNGSLAKGKRQSFSELADREIHSIEAAIAELRSS